VNSGVFSIAGRSAVSNSFFNYEPASKGYTSNSYGTNQGWSYALSAGLRCFQFPDEEKRDYFKR
jgi:hypothetical protein